MLYKHKNIGGGFISVRDEKEQPHLMKPGDELVIGIKREGNGIVILEEIKIDKKKDRRID